jgi:hypothetical protein
MRARRIRLACAAATGVALAPVALFMLGGWGHLIWTYGGVDYTLYMEAARRFLAGGPFYEPWQVAGPYPISFGAILYPPSVLPLLAVFTLLPAVLWWTIPLGLTGYAIRRLRPAPYAWPAMALCLAWLPAMLRIVSGNPVIWAMAALAMGTIYAWPSALVVLKPSLGPFALFGIRHRSWWIALGALVALSIPFTTLWLDWIAAIRHSGLGLTYSVNEVPLMLIPLIAWLARDRSVVRSTDQPAAEPAEVGAGLAAIAVPMPLKRPA